ncbi:MAG: hypothetical protein WC942_10685 [Clostridia bacterium]|jgi:hypothetical protein
MNIERELANICKTLKLLGDEPLTSLALCAYAALTDSETPKVDLSYSYIMRQLRKEDKELRIKFQKAFKAAFEKALYADLENPAEIALMVAVKAIDFKDKNNADDAPSKARETLEPTGPVETRNFCGQPHADPEMSHLSRIASINKVYRKCKHVLNNNTYWWKTKELALKNPSDSNGKLFSASISNFSDIKTINKTLNDKIKSDIYSDKETDVFVLSDGLCIIKDPDILINIIEEDEDVNNIIDVGWRDNSTNAPVAGIGSGSGLGGMDMSGGMGGLGGGAAGMVQLPYSGSGAV